MQQRDGDVPPGMVGVPAVDWMWTRAAQSLFGLTPSIPPGTYIELKSRGTTISQKRNALVASMLAQEGLGWILLADSDMELPRQTVPALLSHDLPIVSGLYFQRAEPHLPEAWHVGRMGSDPLRRTDSEDFEMRSLNLADVGGQRLAEVDAVGAGCLLVRREVFKALDRPFFAANESRDAGLNEDLNFCLRAREAGFPVHVDLGVQPTHLGVTGIDYQHASAHWRAHIPEDERNEHAYTEAEKAGVGG